MKKISFISVILASSAWNLMAQTPVDKSTNGNPPGQYANKDYKSSFVDDGVIQKVDHEYKVQPWKPIRENDIAWYHRVWSIIPVKEKANAPFVYAGDEFSNGGSFIEILNWAIKNKKLTAYSQIDDRFTSPIKAEDLDGLLGIGLDTLYTIDPETEEEIPTYVNRTFNVNSITRYLVKEDWIFDRNSGRVQKRIIGIAPVMDVVNKSSGAFEYSQILYWIHYPSARQFLGQYEVYNPKNMVKRMTWVDYLEGGYFSSQIYKYSKNNPSMKSMYQYANVTGEKGSPPPDFRGLTEGKKAMEDLMNQELDMWER